MVFLFSVPAYVILLRETLEVTIILAVLLGFIDKLVSDEAILRKKLKKQIWIGVAAGFGISLLIGGVFIAVFYTIKKDLWEDSENAWEGAFCLIASVIMTFMALGMVRVQQWKTKWENKLRDATEQYLQRHNQGKRWALILLPFTVVMRETLESILFVAGIGLQDPASGLPIPVITGILSGIFIGFLIYKGSHTMSLIVLFNIVTVFLLFVSAGLFSSAIHDLQTATRSYQHVVWELNCCSPGNNEFWSLMESIFGWRNKATVGTTVGYFSYWLFVGLVILFMWLKEKRNKKGAILERDNQLPSPNNVNDDVEKGGIVEKGEKGELTEIVENEIKQ